MADISAVAVRSILRDASAEPSFFSAPPLGDAHPLARG